MTDPLFLAEIGDEVEPGKLLLVTGDEAHHAVAVKRLAIGDAVLVSDGAGRGIRGVVMHTDRREFSVEVSEILQGPESGLSWGVVQALAKGDRSELAVQMATELGARRIIAWQAARSIVRWQGDRGAKGLSKWQSAAREATKQARRLYVPQIDAADTAAVVSLIEESTVTLVLHEDALIHISEVELPVEGAGLVIVGPEGGITQDELDRFIEAGAQAVQISDAVLRTSTAGAVALGQVDVLARKA